LAQHVAAAVERRERDRAMHVRPGADQHRVDVLRGEQLLPVRIRLRNRELGRGALARLERAIRDGDDLDVRHLAQARHVHRGHDAAGADDADANLAGFGRLPWLRGQHARRERGRERHGCGG